MSDREYYQLRANEEFERAAEASDPAVAAIHAALASAYARKSGTGRSARPR